MSGSQDLCFCCVEIFSWWCSHSQSTNCVIAQYPVIIIEEISFVTQSVDYPDLMSTRETVNFSCCLLPQWITVSSKERDSEICASVWITASYKCNLKSLYVLHLPIPRWDSCSLSQTAAASRRMQYVVCATSLSCWSAVKNKQIFNRHWWP